MSGPYIVRLTACRCPDCSPDPLPSYTRQFLLECFVRAFNAMPPERRKRMLVGMAPGLRAVLDGS